MTTSYEPKFEFDKDDTDLSTVTVTISAKSKPIIEAFVKKHHENNIFHNHKLGVTILLYIEEHDLCNRVIAVLRSYTVSLNILVYGIENANGFIERNPNFWKKSFSELTAFSIIAYLNPIDVGACMCTLPKEAIDAVKSMDSLVQFEFLNYVVSNASILYPVLLANTQLKSITYCMWVNETDEAVKLIRFYNKMLQRPPTFTELALQIVYPRDDDFTVYAYLRELNRLRGTMTPRMRHYSFPDNNTIFELLELPGIPDAAVRSCGRADIMIRAVTILQETIGNPGLLGGLVGLLQDSWEPVTTRVPLQQ